MPFAIAEASDNKFSGLPTALRDAVREPTYVRGEYRIYDNMDSDPLIDSLPAPSGPASRVELLDAIIDQRHDVNAIRVATIQFCRANQRQGPSLPKADSVAFGRVQSFRALLSAIADASSSLTLGAAEALLRNVVTYVPPVHRLSRQRAALRSKRLSRYQMWSYRISDLGHPFREIGATRSDALNALGLGFYSAPDELVRWAHRLPAGGPAFRPTAWDSGAEPGSEHWRPGGSTYRLDRNEYGVEEFVHQPIAGDQLLAAIEPLT